MDHCTLCVRVYVQVVVHCPDQAFVQVQRVGYRNDSQGYESFKITDSVDLPLCGVDILAPIQEHPSARADSDSTARTAGAEDVEEEEEEEKQQSPPRRLHRLRGVAYHRGRDSLSGHWTAAVRHHPETQLWHLCNDRTVTWLTSGPCTPDFRKQLQDPDHESESVGNASVLCYSVEVG